jgi:hypothetical protein
MLFEDAKLLKKRHIEKIILFGMLFFAEQARRG